MQVFRESGRKLPKPRGPCLGRWTGPAISRESLLRRPAPGSSAGKAPAPDINVRIRLSEFGHL